VRVTTRSAQHAAPPRPRLATSTSTAPLAARSSQLAAPAPAGSWLLADSGLLALGSWLLDLSDLDTKHQGGVFVCACCYLYKCYALGRPL
jgi:hypothetical protein